MLDLFFSKINFSEQCTTERSLKITKNKRIYGEVLGERDEIILGKISYINYINFKKDEINDKVLLSTSCFLKKRGNPDTFNAHKNENSYIEGLNRQISYFIKYFKDNYYQRVYLDTYTLYIVNNDVFRETLENITKDEYKRVQFALVDFPYHHELSMKKKDYIIASHRGLLQTAFRFLPVFIKKEMDNPFKHTFTIDVDIVDLFYYSYKIEYYLYIQYIIDSCMRNNIDC